VSKKSDHAIIPLAERSRSELLMRHLTPFDFAQGAG
jgi:hypothetical protein